jgi:hypothetical protein
VIDTISKINAAPASAHFVATANFASKTGRRHQSTRGQEISACDSFVPLMFFSDKFVERP